MATQFNVADINLELYRYPAEQRSNLQGWDAADEHLIRHLAQIDQPPVKTAIINDSFGAIAAALTKQVNGWPLVVETDAKTSQLGTLKNFALNHLDSNNISWHNSRDLLPDGIELVLMKLPKNRHYFAHQLKRLSTVLPANTKVYIGGKAKAIDKALLALLSKNLGVATASLTWKKTRIITCVSDGQPRCLPDKIRWSIPQYPLIIDNFSNIFAANKLDIGTKIMLDNMPHGDFENIIDLGCGNGVLGMRAKQLFPNARVHFVDDSEMAVAATEANWQLNQLDQPPVQPCIVEQQATFSWDDCLSHFDGQIHPDLVLCNPPFHQGEAITDHIAWQMFLDAFRHLKDGGLLQVVGNRHLGYHIKLRRIFNNCRTLASNGKFVILQATKTCKKSAKRTAVNNALDIQG